MSWKPELTEVMFLDVEEGNAGMVEGWLSSLLPPLGWLWEKVFWGLSLALSETALVSSEGAAATGHSVIARSKA